MSWLTSLFRRDATPQPAPPVAASGWRPATRNDGWLNIITGLNTERDKRSGAFFHLTALNDLEAKDLWLGNDMAKRIIEFYPAEATRKWCRVKIATEKDSDIDPDDATQLVDKLSRRAKNLKWKQAVRKAMQMRNAFGGCAIYPVIEGAQGDLSEPVNMDRIQKIVAFHHFEPRELMPMTWYDSIGDEKFGNPETFMVMPIVTGGVPAPELAQVIHESRLIIFQGIKVSRLHQAGTRIGWGDNILNAVQEVLLDYGLAWGSAAALMQDFAQAVLQIDGLANLLVTDQDQLARNRIAQIDLIRSAMRMVVIDSKDTFKREQTPMGSMPEMLDRFNIRLSAAADMPTTALMGISPAGLNATGEADLAFVYNKVGQRQEDVEPQVEQGYRLIMREIEGPFKGKEPELWSIEWLPMYQPDAETIAKTRYTDAQRDDLNINNGVYTAEEAAQSRYGGDEYSPEINLDWDARAQMKALADKLPPQLGGLQPGVPPNGAGAVVPGAPGTPAPPFQTGDPQRQPPQPKGSPFAGANGANRVPVKAHERTARGGE